MKFESTQAFILAVFIAGMMALPFIVPQVYPYLGLCIAVAGIVIGIQHLYIYSRTGENMQFERKEFYRSASITLLLFGTSLLLHCVSLIRKEGITDNYALFQQQPVLWSAVNLFKLSALLSCMTILPMVSLVISYLYPGEKNKNSKKENLLGRFLNYLFFGELELIQNRDDEKFQKNGESVPKYLANLIAWAWYVMDVLICGSIFAIGWDILFSDELFFENRFVQNSGYFLSGTGFFYHIWLLSLCIGFAICSLLIGYRFNSLISGIGAVEGFSMFISFFALFVLPPIIQVSFIHFLTFLMGLLFLICLMVWCYLLRDKYKVLFLIDNPTIYQQKSINYWRLLVTIFVGIILFIIITLTVHSLEEIPETELLKYPFVLFSFSFLTFGCSWMVTIDLGNASKNYQTLLQDFLNGFVIAKVGHELQNGLFAVKIFMQDEELLKILDQKFPEEHLNADRQELKSLHSEAIKKLGTTLQYLQELKSKGSFALAARKRISLERSVNQFIQAYRVSYPKNIEIHYVANSDINLECNPETFHGILRIFVDNAVQSYRSSEKALVTIEWSRHQQKYVSISVIDFGCGMPPKARQNFGQRQVSTKPDGTGIGTAIAMGWLRNLGGWAEVTHSSPNEGTKITFYLPLNSL